MASDSNESALVTETSQPPEPIEVHEIEELNFRSVFPREDRDFTPWLSQPENLARLARALRLPIEFEQTEARTGSFRADILAKRLRDGSLLVTENQFGRSDHDHFGKAMTYLAAHGAKTFVWLAEAFADEHRAALTWLNDNTPEDIGFYAVRPRLMRIAGSPPGLRFDIVVAPNAFVKQEKREERMRSVDPDATIHLLADEDPYRAGSKKAAMFDLVKEGMTVSEYLAAGGTTERVKTMVQYGRIALRK